MTEPPTKYFIPVSQPTLCGNEKAYVNECLDSNWISSTGSFLGRFESQFANYCGVRHGIACCNGTVALHLTLAALDIGPGDEVLVPDLTFVATANAVSYCGATPVLVDCDPVTWNIDAGKLDSLVTHRTKAIIPVHLFGLPADMDAIQSFAKSRNLIVVEDAAEAHGAMYHGKRAGSLGHAGVFSFYGNKIITTGEGGMVVTDDDALAAKLRQLRGQGMARNKRYWFPIMGFNYRMTNVAAAIGLAQLEKIQWHIDQRARVDATYRRLLSGHSGIQFQPQPEGIRHACWTTAIAVAGASESERDAIMEHMALAGVETRPFFCPMHAMPVYGQDGLCFPVATQVARSGIMLPSYATLGDSSVEMVCDALLEGIRRLT